MWIRPKMTSRSVDESFVASSTLSAASVDGSWWLWPCQTRRVSSPRLARRICALLTCLTVSAVTGRTQVPNAPAVVPPLVLSSSSQATLDALAGLRQLPTPEWTLHEGNLPHGELPESDASSWRAVSVPSTSSSGAVWYRATIKIPEDLQGYSLADSRIWFQIHVQAQGPVPEIVYFDGRRVALGDNLEPLILFEHAQPGESVAVAVKVLPTPDAKRFAGATLRIETPANRPAPSDLLTEFLTARQLLPELSHNLARDVATLEGAIQAVQPRLLERRDDTGFDDSLRRAHNLLEPLKPVLRQATFSLSGNAHIDAAWLWPWTETVDVVKRTFSTALQLMDEYPDYTFTQSSAAYSEWIKEKYPLLHEQIRKRVQEGRWEIVGGMWVEPDLNMPDGEAELRNLLLGKQWFRREYGVDVRIGWNPDSFGYDWQLPQIYKKSGIDYFVTQKVNWNDTNHFPFHLLWWQSPDGSRVLTYFPTDYVHLDLDPARIAKDFSRITQDTPGLRETMDLYGVGDHGGGPTRAILDEGEHWKNADAVVPRMQFATAQSFFNDVEHKVATDSPVWDYRRIAKGYTPPAAVEGRIAIPIWNSELYFEYHRGVLTSQAEHKRSMREGEVEVLEAERFASLAWLAGKSYPLDELTEDWRSVAFNEFHDLAAGSGIGGIYKDAQKDFARVRLSTDAIRASSFEVLASNINTQPSPQMRNSAAILVFNPLAWRRSALTEVEVELPFVAEGLRAWTARGPVEVQIEHHERRSNHFRILISAAEIPSLGYEVLHVAGEEASTNSTTALVKATATELENATLRIRIDAHTGCITSLLDKRSGFESIASGGCGNQLQAFHDNPTQYDAWNIDSGTLDHPMALDDVDSVEVAEAGPIRAAIRVTRSWQSSRIVQTISLDAGADFVNIATDVDWHEKHILLKAAVPLAASSDEATYEIPFGTIERPTTRDNSWEKARFEVPALRWADLGDGKHGLTLINNSKYGYDAQGNTLRLSLLRSPTWPDPDADQGHHHFSYALYPHAGDWKEALSVRHGYEYNYPLLAQQVLEHAGAQPAERSFFSLDADNVVLTAVKKAEDGDSLVLHLYEWAGKKTSVSLQVPSGATAAEFTDLMERAASGTLEIRGDTVTVPMKPFAIEAVRVDYRPPPQ